ncbi:MAG: helix-turn-helix domain-containing protein [Micavibrio sp.]|nr:helix-turn-helix domain-containing protein [Micavibrio sp.]
MKMYHYTESGLDNIWLVNGFKEHKNKYGKGISIDNADDLHKAIGCSIAKGASKIKPQEFKFLRVQIELSQKNLGALMGVDAQTIARWEKGQSKDGIPGPAEKLIRHYYLEKLEGHSDIAKICEHLAELDEREHAKKRKFEDVEGDWRIAS